MYFTLSFLILWGIFKQGKAIGTRFVVIIIVILVVVSFSILMELLQFLKFIKRTAEFFDILANVSGCVAGIFVFYIIFEKLLFKSIKK